MIEMTGIATYSAIALAAIGLYIAAYFTLVYYGLIQANTRLMPNVCRLDEGTCQTVLSTKYARVFGLPNSLLGVLYYVAVIVLLAGGWATGSIGLALIVVSWFTVALGLFLVYALFFIIKIPCPLCLAGHTINLALGVLMTIVLFI
jgi:uncharacterized membrane protein